jgi:EAL domain-containing protein (putative c-di-GMP-specific phosphodiesterase class I)/FixJ family two-component response regulator
VTAATSPLGVLVVDDEPLVAREVARGLARSGLSVQTADCAAKALDLVASRRDIGVVVTDIRMPGEDGLKLAARLLAKRPDQEALEVVLVTGHATLEDATAAVRSGAFDFIQKPFRLAELRAAVGRAMARAEQKRGAAAALAAAREAAKQAAGTDHGHGLADAAALQRRIAGASPDEALALLRFDLDRQKAVTERLGDFAAEELCATVAERLRAASGPDSLMARLGPQGLALLRPGLPSAALAETLATLHEALTEPLRLTGTRFMPEISAAAAHSDTAGLAGLLPAAEAALAAARRSHRLEVFSPESHAALLRHAELARDLLAEIDQDGLRLHYQPILRLSDGTLDGFEALLRWQHPRHGLIPPGEFLPLTEEFGLGPCLDRLVINKALAQLRDWSASCDPVPINVNVSAKTLSAPGFLDHVRQALRKAGVPPRLLCVEVTEGQALSASAAPVLRALREAGLRVAVDDFGTGYSSLARLREMPADTVKLDRAFLHGPAEGDAGRDFLQRIVELAHSLSLRVVAEGVETEAEHALVRDAGCNAAQGYLFAPPLPPEQAMQRLVRTAPAARLA